MVYPSKFAGAEEKSNFIGGYESNQRVVAPSSPQGTTTRFIKRKIGENAVLYGKYGQAGREIRI